MPVKKSIVTGKGIFSKGYIIPNPETGITQKLKVTDKATTNAHGKWELVDNCEVEFTCTSGTLTLLSARPIQKDPKELVDESGVYVPMEIQRIVPMAQHFFSKGKHFAFMFKGKSGVGKTTMFSALAKLLNIKLVYIDLSQMLEPLDIFGQMVLRDGDTYFEFSEFVEQVEHGHVLIVLDEVNRCDPRITNILFPLMDFRGQTTIRDRIIKAGANVFWGATLNEGADYSGTYRLDKAFSNRFSGILTIDYPGRAEEIAIVHHQTSQLDIETVEKIVDVIRRFRDVVESQSINVDVGPRASINVAQFVESGLDIKTAFDYAIVNRVDRDDQKSLIDVLSSSNL